MGVSELNNADPNKPSSELKSPGQIAPEKLVLIRFLTKTTKKFFSVVLGPPFAPEMENKKKIF